MPLNRMVRGASSERYPMAWMFWVLRSGDRVVLVDCGFEDEELRRKWGIEPYRRPVEILLDLQIEPGDVTDVVLTHLHWDHVGSIHRFRNAKVWLQKREWKWARGIVGADERRAHGVQYTDVLKLETIKEEGRLALVSGDKNIYPGLHLVAGGCHTPGFQWVWVETVVGNVVIASDAAYLYKNLDGPTPLPCRRWSESVRTLNRMLSIAGAKEQVLPGHSIRVFELFPKVNSHVVRIAPSPVSG